MKRIFGGYLNRKNTNLFRLSMHIAYGSIIGYSLAWSIYFSLTSNLGTPPDELYHIGITNLFSRLDTILLSNNPETYTFGDVTRTPFLYHFFIGKIQAVSPFSLNYIHLRFINVLLGLLYYLFAFNFVVYLTKSNFSRSIFLTLLSFTPMIPFLFGSLTYDNFTNLFSIISLYLFVLYINENNIRYLYLNILVGILGVLSKFTFLPLFIIEVIIMGIMAYNNYRRNGIQYFALSTNKLLIFANSFLLLIPAYFYGLNILTFNSITPSCIEVLTHEQCLNNKIYTRALEFKENFEPVNSSLYIFYDYSKFWGEKIFENLFSIFGHTILSVDKDFVAVLIFTVVLGFILIIRNINLKVDYYLLAVMLFYAAMLFYTNYNGYINTGVKPLAIQGRYLIPILPIFYYLISKYFVELLKKIPNFIKVLFVLVLLLLLNKYTYFNFYHQIKLSGGFNTIEIPVVDYLIYKIAY